MLSQSNSISSNKFGETSQCLHKLWHITSAMCESDFFSNSQLENSLNHRIKERNGTELDFWGEFVKHLIYNISHSNKYVNLNYIPACHPQFQSNNQINLFLFYGKLRCAKWSESNLPIFVLVDEHKYLSIPSIL